MKLVVLFLLALACVSAVQIDHIQKRLHSRTKLDAKDILKDRRVIVTMSYMDEEAAAVANAALGHLTSASATYIVERAISPNEETMLWERPISTYTNADRGVWLHDWNAASKEWKTQKKVHPTGDPTAVRGDDPILLKFQAALKKNINNKAGLAAQLTAAHLKGAKLKTCKTEEKVEGKKTGVCSEWYHAVRLYTFGAPDWVKKNPILIIIRTPEMGMDMGIFQIYNNLLLDSVKELVESKKHEFYAIGASGAANKIDCVGRMRRLDASLFVGVKPVENKGKPYIAFDTVKGREPETIFESDTVTSPDMFELQPKIKDYTAEDPKHDGMTASYFMGLSTKKASNDVGTHAANTEDFWMIKLIEDYKDQFDAKKFAVFRVDADPYPSNADAKLFVEKEKAWVAGHKCVPRATYKAALKWASEGMKTNAVPAELCWTDIGLDNKYFFQAKKKGSEDKCNLNPLFIEAATDLCKDVNDIPDWNRAHNFAVYPWDGDAADTFLGRVATRLQTVAGIECGGSDMPLFLRNGWGNAYDTNTKHATAAGGSWPWTGIAKKEGKEEAYVPNETAADRMLYKASNFGALKNLADTLFESLTTIAQYANPDDSKKLPKCAGNEGDDEEEF